jgi:ABC-type glycerol-3-phosphate transport system substrate-binding protein
MPALKSASRISRRSLLKASGVLFLSAAPLLQACAPTVSQPTSAPAESGASPTQPPATAAAVSKPASSDAPVTIVFARHQYDATDVIIKDLISQYQQENPHVTINFEIQRDVDHRTKTLLTIAAGSGPDMFDIPNDMHLRYAESGLLAEIPHDLWGGKEAYEQYWEDGTVDAIRVDGKDYSIPGEWGAIPGAYFVNTRLAEEAGLEWKQYQEKPITWDELPEWAAKMTVKDDSGRITRDGFLLHHSYGAARTYAFFEDIFLKKGGKVLSDDNKQSLLNTDEGYESMQYLYDLVYKYEASLLRPKDPEGNSGKLAKEESASGTQLGYWAYGTFDTVNPESAPYIKALIAPQVAGKPEIFHSGPGWNWAVNGKSKVADEAFQFLKYLADHGGDIFESGIVLPRRNWVEEYPAAKDLRDSSTWLYMIKNSQVRFRSKEELFTSAERNESLQRAFDNVMFNNVPVKDAVDTMNEEVSAALSELEV